MAPVLPSDEVPELNERRPLVPAAPAFADFIRIRPLLDDELYPDSTYIRPPVFDEVSPASNVNIPPLPEVPLPTVSEIEPPLPLVAAPEPIEIDPLLPPDEVPELNTKRPVIPDTPALLVRILISPLDVEEPLPLSKAKFPPVFFLLSPALK